MNRTMRWLGIGSFFYASVSGLWAQSWLNPAGGSWGVSANWSGGAVPGGTAQVAFTNGHEGAVEVTLDGDRSQTGGMLFGEGDWKIFPGMPGTSTLTLGGTVTSLAGIATLAVSGGTTGGGKLVKRGSGELIVAAKRMFDNTPAIEEGVLRVAAEGTIKTGASIDMYVDGMGMVIVDGGVVETKIIRLGQDMQPDGSLFRMNAGSVECGGSGDAVLLIGYQGGTPLQGWASVEILGGTFMATGTVSNGGAFIGGNHHGCLLIAGTNGIPSEMSVARLWFGWKDTSRDFATTNTCVIESNAVVSASVAVLKHMPLCRGDLYLNAGGILRTPTVYATAGEFAFHFEGGRLEMTAPSNTLFSGSGMAVSVSATSELDIGTNNVSCPASFSGSGVLRKRGSGTLTVSGDHSAFDGTWAVAEGTLTVTSVNGLPETAAILLSDGATLNVSAVPSMSAQIFSTGNVTVVSHTNNMTFRAVTLAGGNLSFVGDGFLSLLSLDIPEGAVATISCVGHVTIGALFGSGTLVVSGGGTFDVLDDSAWNGSLSAASDGSVLKRDQAMFPSLHLSSDTALDTYGKVIVVNALTLSGSSLCAVGGGEVVVQSLTVNGSSTIVADGGGTVTNIAALVFEQGAELYVETAQTVHVGSAKGAGTIQLGGGILVIGELHSGVGFDIADGEICVTPTPTSAVLSPLVSGEPAFWADASQGASFTTTDGKLEWNDWRGGGHTMKAVSMGVLPSVVPEPSLGGLSAVKFASPYNNGAYKGMAWNQRLENVRTVFWVIGAQEGGGQLLGDTNHIDLLRGEYPPGRLGAGAQLDWPKGIHYAPFLSQVYATQNRDHMSCAAHGLLRVGGTAVNPTQNGFPHPGYHVVSLRTTNNICAAAFATERTLQNPSRSGCQRLAECLVFTNVLTDAEIDEAEAYLRKKWFGAGVQTGAVRLRNAGARFNVQNGEVVASELRVDTEGIHPTNMVTGVVRVERLVIPHALTLDYDGATESLPLNIQSLCVENGADVIVDAPSHAAVWLGKIAGDGNIAVAGGAFLDVGSVATLDGEELTLEIGTAVPVTVRSWLGQGKLEIAGASAVNLPQADISGNAHLAVTGGVDIPLEMSIIRATGAWTLSGSINPSIDTVFLYGDGQTLTLDTGGNDLCVTNFNGRNALVWNGPDKIRIIGTLLATDGNNPALPIEAFTPYIPVIKIGSGSRSLGFTGNGALAVGTFSTENEPLNPFYINFDHGVSMTTASLQHRSSNGADLWLPQEGLLIISNLTMRGDQAIFFPSNRVTEVQTLTIPAGERCIVRGGTLRIVQSMATPTRFTVIGDGIIFPSGTVLAPALWDIRTPSRFDLGEGSTFTFNIASQTNVYAMTFAGGTLAIQSDTVFLDALHLDGTMLSIASGRALTAEAITGESTVALGENAILNVAELCGFDGVFETQGGVLNISNTRVNRVPNGPTGTPAFWVDASEVGSLVSNSPTRLVWLDKRTVRDGTPGLMYATSSNMPTMRFGELNGLPVVDFGPLGTNATHEKGMTWSQRLTDVRAVHWVIGAQNGGGQMLGDYKGGHIDYFRYSDQTSTPYTNNYGYGDYRTPLWSGTRFYSRANEYISNVVDGVTCMNGELMAAPGFTDGFPSANYHLLSLRTAGPTWAAAFASERVGGGYGNRSGAQRLGEVLVYNGTVLTEAQGRANDAYLSWKWFARLLPTYRAPDEGLVVLRGSGVVQGSDVLAREVAPSAAGLSVEGNLRLDFYSSAVAVGAVIKLDTLPAPGTSAVSVSGDVYLPSQGTVILGEARAGSFGVLAAGGSLNGSENLVGWRVESAGVPNTDGYRFNLGIQGEMMVLEIVAKGTMIMLR